MPAIHAAAGLPAPILPPPPPAVIPAAVAAAGLPGIAIPVLPKAVGGVPPKAAAPAAAVPKPPGPIATALAQLTQNALVTTQMMQSMQAPSQDQGNFNNIIQAQMAQLQSNLLNVFQTQSQQLQTDSFGKNISLPLLKNKKEFVDFRDKLLSQSSNIRMDSGDNLADYLVVGVVDGNGKNIWLGWNSEPEQKLPGVPVVGVLSAGDHKRLDNLATKVYGLLRDDVSTNMRHSGDKKLFSMLSELSRVCSYSPTEQITMEENFRSSRYSLGEDPEIWYNEKVQVVKAIPSRTHHPTTMPNMVTMFQRCLAHIPHFASYLSQLAVSPPDTNKKLKDSFLAMAATVALNKKFEQMSSGGSSSKEIPAEKKKGGDVLWNDKGKGKSTKQWGWGKAPKKEKSEKGPYNWQKPDLSNVQCWNCEKYGHKSDSCWAPKKKGGKKDDKKGGGKKGKKGDKGGGKKKGKWDNKKKKKNDGDDEEEVA